MNYMGQFDHLFKSVKIGKEHELYKILLEEAEGFEIDIHEDIFYIKNLWIEDKLPILFVFSDKKIIKISIEDSEKSLLSVEFCDRSKISSVKYLKNYNLGESVLNFKINDIESILNPLEDVNEHHIKNYIQLVDDIIKYLKK